MFILCLDTHILCVIALKLLSVFFLGQGLAFFYEGRLATLCCNDAQLVIGL